MSAAVGFEPGRGPGPRTQSEQGLLRLIGAHQFGVLATNKRSGHPHLSTMVYSWDPVERVARISSRVGRAKVRQLERDARAALYVTSADHMAFAVAEGVAEVSPPSAVAGDAVGRELLSLQPAFDDPEAEAAFLRNVVEDQRVVIRLRVAHLYGGGLAVPSAEDS